MRSRFRYVRPQSLVEALAFLSKQGPLTALIAGGTDLSITIRNGELRNDYVLDVSRLGELKTVELSEGVLCVGAGLTFTEIVRNPVIAAHAPVLVAAAACVGSRQIRNVGTIGGNVANASPAADSVPALMVLNAQVVLQSAGASRTVSLKDVIAGPYLTDLRPNEIITRFLLEPIPADYRYNFQRLARRRALAIARINCAAVGFFDRRGAVADLRLCMGSIMPRPCRLKDAEDFLKAKIPTFSALQEAAAVVSREMTRQSGVRPSTEYKKPAVEGLLIKTVAQMIEPTPCPEGDAFSDLCRALRKQHA